MNAVLEQRPDRLPLSTACTALGLNRSSVYTGRQRLHTVGPPKPHKRSRKGAVQPRALSAQEQAQVIETLQSEPFQDQPPAEVYQRLLEQDTCLCSVSTMHRLLRQQGENGERRLDGLEEREQRLVPTADERGHHPVGRTIEYSPKTQISVLRSKVLSLIAIINCTIICFIETQIMRGDHSG